MIGTYFYPEGEYKYYIYVYFCGHILNRITEYSGQTPKNFNGEI